MVVAFGAFPVFQKSDQGFLRRRTGEGENRRRRTKEGESGRKWGGTGIYFCGVSNCDYSLHWHYYNIIIMYVVCSNMPMILRSNHMVIIVTKNHLCGCRREQDHWRYFAICAWGLSVHPPWCDVHAYILPLCSYPENVEHVRFPVAKEVHP